MLYIAPVLLCLFQAAPGADTERDDSGKGTQSNQPPEASYSLTNTAPLTGTIAARRLDAALAKHGVPHHVEIDDVQPEHNEPAWASRFPRAIAYLLGNGEKLPAAGGLRGETSERTKTGSGGRRLTRPHWHPGSSPLRYPSASAQRHGPEKERIQFRSATPVGAAKPPRGGDECAAFHKKSGRLIKLLTAGGDSG